jgi:hypothetical protein
MTSTKPTPAAIAANAIIADLRRRTSGWLISDEDPRDDIRTEWAFLIAQATQDACEQAEQRVRAEERERVARLFDEEAEHPAMRHAANALRGAAAFVRHVGPAMIRHSCPHCDGCEVASLRDLPRKCQAHEPAIVDAPQTSGTAPTTVRNPCTCDGSGPEWYSAGRREERADVAAYLRGLLPAGVDDLARFIERCDHVGAGKAKGE